MKLRMKLLSDTIFGSGNTETGGMDISLQVDSFGFPYYKGSTFKGVFREMLEQYLDWTMEEQTSGDKKAILTSLLGEGGSDVDADGKLVFSDFCMSKAVKERVLEEIGTESPERVTQALSNIRTFTSITDAGVVEKGSLRTARCVDQGLMFYGEIQCNKEDEPLVLEVVTMIKWIGTMRSRGFGKVRIDECREVVSV